MQELLKMATLGLSLMSAPLLGADYQTGLADLIISDARDDRPLSGFVWYPTEDNAVASLHHSNPVWQGIAAIADAAPAKGSHPLVVLSHGMYGNAMNQSWLAGALAQEGYVVAAISHPGTSTWMRDPDHARQMWDRPGDVSRVIDFALSDPGLSAMIDPEQIYIAGHSLGGFTAVALAGGRYDAPKIDAFCEAAPNELVCGIFNRWQVAQTPEDVTAMQADLSDDRIKAFAVFDLGGTQMFSLSSLGQIEIPMLVMGAPKDISGLDLDIESRALRAALPETTVRYMEPESLSHFDFLGLCTPAAVHILAEEEPGDEIICQGGGEEREADHQMIIEAVLATFK